MKFFLHAKHWLIFLLLFVAPVVMDAILDSRVADDAGWMIKLLLNAIIVFLGIAYLWTLGTRLYERLPEKSGNLSPAWFKAGLVYAFFELIYLTSFAGFFLIEDPRSPYYLVPVHMLAMVALFYAIYFVAKSLAGVELGRNANLNDFAGYFFMLWFYPVGIWFFQPRVNRIFS